MAVSAASKSLDKSAVVPARQLPTDVDLVRSYLRDIGRVPLLSHEQEITLGRQVQELMSLEQLES
ncbi:sigma-70 factor domain-containing protein, partial [Prochlorococcus marinus]